MTMKADGGEIVDKKESGPNGAAATADLESSVIGTTRDVAEGSNKLGGTEEKRVFHKQIGQKVETTGFEVRSSMDGRGRVHKQIDGIRGGAKGMAFAEGPRVKVTKSSDDVVAADMVEEVGGYLGWVSLTGAM